MAGANKGLGRGLDALIRETTGGQKREEIQTLALTSISPNPSQPRRHFVEKALEELAASIRAQGLLQPLVVRPLEGSPNKYEIVAGERRWRACRLAGLTEVPVVVRSFSDMETLTAAMIENLQREDLNPLEEAMGFQMLKEEYGLSQEDLAMKLGKSRSSIANSLRLLALPENLKKDLAEGRLTAGHGRVLLSVVEDRAQGYLRNLILEENLSVREAEGLAANWKATGDFFAGERGSAGGADKPNDATLTAGQGPEDSSASVPALKKENIPAQKSPQSAVLMDVQNRIKGLFDVPVRVTGKEDKGKISLTFSSKSELESILGKLALLAGEGSDRPMLAQTVLPELDTDSSKSLSHLDMAELPARDNAALEGAEPQAMLPANTGGDPAGEE